MENPACACCGGYGGLIRTLIQELPVAPDRAADGGSKWQKSTKARLTALSAKRSALSKDKLRSLILDAVWLKESVQYAALRSTAF